jgi:hypothetical protein
MADLAYKGEKEAKGNKDDKGRKDSIALFYNLGGFVFPDDEKKSAVKWDDKEKACAEKILSLVDKFSSFGEFKDGSLEFKDGLSRGFIYNLFNVTQQMKESEKFYLHLPKLAYALSRAEGSISESSKDKWKDLRDKLFDLNTSRYLHPALVWIDLLLRKEG